MSADDASKAEANKVEKLRAGMRLTMLEKLKASTLSQPAGGRSDLVGSRNDLVAEFEKVIFERVWLKVYGVAPNATKKPPQDASERFRVAYAREAAAAARALGAPVDLFPDTTLAILLMRKEITPAAAADPKMLAARGEDTPRDTCRRLFLGSLLKYIEQLAAAATENKQTLTRPLALKLALDLEKSCYKAVIESCKTDENPFRRSWESPQFVALYSARCGTVNSLIDPDSSACRAYGSDVVERLLNGLEEGRTANSAGQPVSDNGLSAAAVGGMAAAELCPKATEKERAEIALRSEQKLVEKASELFGCPACRARKCTYREIYTRSLDEPADLFLKCLECGHRWRIRG